MIKVGVINELIDLISVGEVFGKMREKVQVEEKGDPSCCSCCCCSCLFLSYYSSFTLCVCVCGNIYTEEK